MRQPGSWRGLALIWSSDIELAEAVAAALEVVGYSALVPGARSFTRLCRKAALVVADERDLVYMPDPCRGRVLVVGSGPSRAAASVLAHLGAYEVVIGVDPGKVSTGYALVSGNSLVYGGVLRGGPHDVGRTLCGIASAAPPGTLVGVGAAPAVAPYARIIVSELQRCGVDTALVDEHGSNTASVLGLRGMERSRSVHVRAAAVIALRARMSTYRATY